MLMLGSGMQRIYEILAFVVALYFPVALLTWLVIDKFVPTGSTKGHAARQPPGKDVHGHVLSGRARPGA